MMFCVKFARRHSSGVLQLTSKACYSRRSDRSTSSYKVVKSNGESLDDVDNAVFETNLNWELLTPRGFRFYLPGSVGPGWHDASTTAQSKPCTVHILYGEEALSGTYDDVDEADRRKKNTNRTTLQCLAQDCPMLLRKGIEELFPGCLDVSSPQLTIVTLKQRTNFKTMRWSKDLETEKLVKSFVLTASDICAKLKMVGYWADFINPFSGQPYFSPVKNNALYQTDERFRCLGFKIELKKNCKIISYDYNIKNFIGNLYTTAPASTDFLKDLIYNEDGE